MINYPMKKFISFIKSSGNANSRFKNLEYDKETQIPYVRCNTCNNEMMAGFKDKATGKFHGLELLYSEEEISLFAKACGVEKVDKGY